MNRELTSSLVAGNHSGLTDNSATNPVTPERRINNNLTDPIRLWIKLGTANNLPG